MQFAANHTHDVMGCPQRDAYPDFVAEQVNAFNNYPRQRNDVYSNFYNPGWRDHPNLKWGGEQQVKQPFPPPVQPPAAPAKASWELAIDKLADATRIGIEQSNQNLQKYQQTMNQNMQNMQASITNLERQFGQLAGTITEREKGKFPSQTVQNPRGTADCNAVRALRSGKSYDNRNKESD